MILKSRGTKACHVVNYGCIPLSPHPPTPFHPHLHPLRPRVRSTEPRISFIWDMHQLFSLLGHLHGKINYQLWTVEIRMCHRVRSQSITNCGQRPFQIDSIMIDIVNYSSSFTMSCLRQVTETNSWRNVVVSVVRHSSGILSYWYR